MWQYNSLYHADDCLQHFGVLGMKWGHRKSRTKSSAKTKTKNKELKKSEKKAVAKQIATEQIIAKQLYKKYKKEAKDISKQKVGSAFVASLAAVPLAGMVGLSGGTLTPIALGLGAGVVGINVATQRSLNKKKAVAVYQRDKYAKEAGIN